MGLVPQRVARRLLTATARQARVSVEAGLHTNTPGEDILGGAGAGEVPEEAARYQAGVTEAVHAMVLHVADAAEALLHELPALVRDISRSTPVQACIHLCRALSPVTSGSRCLVAVLRMLSTAGCSQGTGGWCVIVA